MLELFLCGDSCWSWSFDGCWSWLGWLGFFCWFWWGWCWFGWSFDIKSLQRFNQRIVFLFDFCQFDLHKKWNEMKLKVKNNLLNYKSRNKVSTRKEVYPLSVSNSTKYSLKGLGLQKHVFNEVIRQCFDVYTSHLLRKVLLKLLNFILH